MSERNVAIRAEVSGHFILSTNKRGVVAEFSNLITDAGLNNLVNFLWFNGVFIGTGNTPPTVNDTDLASYLNFSAVRMASTTGTTTSAPYYTWFRRTFRFEAGMATGNLTEIAMGWRSGTVNNLISRTLIKDANGIPTTLTILADEILDVTYEFRYYIPLTDVSGNITFSGNIGGTHAYVIRPANISTNTSSGWNAAAGAHANPAQNLCIAYAGGGLGTIFSEPSGAIITTNSSFYTSSAAYVLNSYTLTSTYVLGVDWANDPRGIKCMRVPLGPGTYQIEFDPPIPKTNADTLSFTLSYTWGRKT